MKNLAQLETGTVLIPFSIQLLQQMVEWSPPVQVRAVHNNKGKYGWSLEIRTVTLTPAGVRN